MAIDGGNDIGGRAGGVGRCCYHGRNVDGVDDASGCRRDAHGVCADCLREKRVLVSLQLGVGKDGAKMPLDLEEFLSRA